MVLNVNTMQTIFLKPKKKMQPIPTTKTHFSPLPLKDNKSLNLKLTINLSSFHKDNLLYLFHPPKCSFTIQNSYWSHTTHKWSGNFRMNEIETECSIFIMNEIKKRYWERISLEKKYVRERQGNHYVSWVLFFHKGCHCGAEGVLESGHQLG